MSTVRTIVPPGVAQANQLKLRCSALEAENAELRQRIGQLIALCAGGGMPMQAQPSMQPPMQMPPAVQLPGDPQLALAAGAPMPMQAAPRMLAGAEGIPQDVMAGMLAELAAPIPNASQRVAAQIGNGVHVSGDGSSVKLMTRDDAAALARSSQANKLAAGGAGGRTAQTGAVGQVFTTPQGGTVRMVPRPAHANAAQPTRTPQPAALPFNGQAMPPQAWAAYGQRLAPPPAPPTTPIAPTATGVAPVGSIIDAKAYEVAELGSAGRAPVAVPSVARPPFAGSAVGRSPAFRE